MAGGELQTLSLKAQEHLHVLRSLAAELQRAISAISSNNLHELEDSITTQQDLSSRLHQLASELSHSASSPSPSASGPVSAELMPEIRAAAAELQVLNRRYSILIRNSSRSVALMVSLFNSFTGQLKEVPGARLKLQTWSCQV